MSKLPNGTLSAWVSEVAFAYSGNDCLIWPFAPAGNGYALVARKGTNKKDYVHRLVCEHRHGPPPTQRHEAAHSCGNGHLGCVNPDHLRWATRTENMRDRGLHRGAKALHANDVREIRRLRQLIGPTEIARRFGVTPTTIHHVLTGHTWSWLTD